MEVGQGLGRLRTGPYRCMCNRLLARRPFIVPRFGLGPPGVWPERAGGVGGRVGVGMEVRGRISGWIMGIGLGNRGRDMEEVPVGQEGGCDLFRHLPMYLFLEL